MKKGSHKKKLDNKGPRKDKTLVVPQIQFLLKNYMKYLCLFSIVLYLFSIVSLLRVIMNEPESRNTKSIGMTFFKQKFVRKTVKCLRSVKNAANDFPLSTADFHFSSVANK